MKFCNTLALAAILGYVGCGSNVPLEGCAKEKAKCQEAEAQRQPGGAGFFPCLTCQTSDSTRYEPKQCNGSTGYCWCVDSITGEQIGEEERAGTNLNCAK